ncbi:2'-deoxynucleoside 5'-phosphate N-hydrolase 1 [Cololabis saira]|uniref:2'-deoxynucleoside 5'-phosphate N-hydrolase 1 n=1 Tax=Cololabis saira TaxID=129043 RepID=UPI002AD204BC|nr:2'-deoxynucleoside 5'-phosphate N-hydrolase 1 [Cololabis saira]
MKIYFCGSIRGGRDDVHVYRRIVHALQKYGTVLTEHVGDERLDLQGESGPAGVGGDQDQDQDQDRFIHDRDVDWLQQSDAVVAEVTQPSLGVGYELGRAVAMETRVLCLFRPSPGRVLSAMIRGAAGEKFLVKNYREDELDQVLDQVLEDFLRPPPS